MKNERSVRPPGSNRSWALGTLSNVTGGATVWLALTLGGILLFVIWFAGMGIKMVRGKVSPGAGVPGR